MSLTVARHVTVSFSDAPLNTVLSRITPVTVFRQRYGFRVRIFGVRVRVASVTVSISVRNPRLSFVTGTPASPAIVQFSVDVRFVAGIVQITPNVSVVVVLILDPNFRQVSIVPTTATLTYSFRLFGRRVFTLRIPINLTPLRLDLQLPNLNQTMSFPVPVSRTVNLAPINGAIRTVSSFLISEADISVT